MDRFKAAIVGLGKMGLLHASILNIMPNVELSALCDKNFLLLRFAKKLFKSVKVVDDVAKLSNLNIDFVYVTTPIPTHFPVVKTIYLNEVTRNLFVEKTLASSWEKAKELCNLAQKFRGVNMVGYMKRFSCTFRKARSLLDQGILGELDYFDAHAYSSDFSKFQRGLKMAGFRGGVLGDLGSHVIDLALWFFGDLEVESAIMNSMTDGSCEDSAHFAVRKKGLKGKFDISWCMNNYRLPHFELAITGREGIMKVNDDALELKLNNGASSLWYKQSLGDNVDFLLGEPEYYREDEFYFKSITNANNAEPSFESASKVDYVIEQVKKEAKKHDQQKKEIVACGR
jgi:predicted dehydrogenase